MKDKINYFLRSLYHLNQRKVCPYCANDTFTNVDSKYLVTSLIKCKQCSLNFRFPVDSEAFLNKFYQSDYKSDTHIITKLPTDEELTQLMATDFSNLRSFVPYMEALTNVQHAKVIDYGCSWGYTVFQLKNAGFDAVGFEISVPRANYGRKIGVEIYSDTSHLRKENDILMSSHVIEHLSDIPAFVNTSKTVLKEDGIFFAVCPNGSKAYKEREPDIYHVNWGFLHPNYLDTDFAAFLFKNNPYLILTGDWEHNLELISEWDGKSQHIGAKKDGKELLIISKPNVEV